MRDSFEPPSVTNSTTRLRQSTLSSHLVIIDLKLNLIISYVSYLE